MYNLGRKTWVHFAVNSVEMEALRRLQQVEGAKATEVMRLALRELARQRGCWPVVADKVSQQEVQA